MMAQTARNSVRSISVSAVVTRADGTVEPLGCVAYWHRNPLVRAYVYARTFLNNLFGGSRHG